MYEPAIRQALRPLGDKLMGQITLAFGEGDDKTVREAAVFAILDFVADDGDSLTEFAITGTAKQFSILYPEVAKHAATDSSLIDKLIQVTKLQPADGLNEAQRIALGKRRAGAAICLLRMGHVEESLEVLRVKEDPESLTQFVHGCKPRGITVEQLLDLLNRATTVSERYGLLFALGEFELTDISEDIRPSWVEYIKNLYATDPSSGIHGASGWLPREWGRTEEAKAIEGREVPYSADREWFTFKINLSGPMQFENYSYFKFVVFPAGEYEIGSLGYESGRRKLPVGCRARPFRG